MTRDSSGAGYETVEWSQVSDPKSYDPIVPIPYAPPSQTLQNLSEFVRYAEGAVKKITGLDSAAPAELRPPPEYADKPLHWVQDEAGDPDVLEWHGSGWGVIGKVYDESPSEMADLGYRYLGPAEWKPEAGVVDVEFTSPADARPAVIARIRALVADNVRLRALLSRVEDPPTDPVQSNIERTIDHLVKGQTTQKQRKDLATATERAERDAAVGRVVR